MNKKQSELFIKQSLSYGGELLKTRKGRSYARPIDAKHSMHLVLRSTKAKGEYSFKKAKNSQAIHRIFKKFTTKYGVKIISLGNAGNHLHLEIKLAHRSTYKPFIRAVTAAIAMALSGVSRWKPSELGKFWDYRPFTRVVIGYMAKLQLRDYIKVNEWEGVGLNRFQARRLVAEQRHKNNGRMLHI